MTKKSFKRCRDLLKKNGTKTIFATISAFTGLYVIKYIIDIFTSGKVAWVAVLLLIASLGALYNKFSQAKHKKDMKNALLLDWHDLPIKTHLLITGLAVALAFFVKIIIITYYYLFGKVDSQPIKNSRLLTYGKIFTE